MMAGRGKLWADSGPSASGFADALNGLSVDDPIVDIGQVCSVT